MKLSTRLILLFIFLTVIPLIIISILAYVNMRDTLTTQITAQLTSIADAKKRQINQVLKSYLEIVRLVDSGTQLRMNVQQYADKPSKEVAKSITSIITDVASATDTIVSISVIDHKGSVIATTDQTNQNVDKRPRQYVSTDQQAEKLQKIFKDNQNIPRVLLVGPLTLNNKVVGFVEIVAVIDPIMEVTEEYSGLGSSGEVLLVTKNEVSDVLFLTPSRFDAGAALRRAVSRDRTDAPSVLSVQGHEGIFTSKATIDYREVPVLAATRYVDSVGWGLVVKIDQDEAFEPVSIFLKTFITIIIITMMLVALTGVFSSHEIIKPILNLAQAADRLSRSDFTTSISYESNDEIGVLANAFRNMASKLKKYYEELEEKVQERTQLLVQSNKELVEAQEVGKVGTFTLNFSKKTLSCSNEVFRLYGLQPISNPDLDLFIKSVHPDDIKRGLEVWQKAIETIQPFEVDVRVIMPDKSIHWLRSKGQPNKDTSGKFVEMIGTTQDVTKEKQLDQMKDDFVSITSHELRTPMSAIKSIISMMQDGDYGAVNENLKDPLSDVAVSAERLIRLVNDILNVSRIEAGRLKYTLINTTLNPIVNEIVSIFKPLSHEKGLSIKVQNIVDDQIQTDPDRVKEILSNLIGNAMKFTDTGEISITTKTDDTYMYVVVSDTGIGIEEKYGHKLFGKFEQIANEQKGRPPGTGLGLYISKQMSHTMGGDLWLEKSEPGKGSTFVFSIPRADSQIAAKVRDSKNN